MNNGEIAGDYEIEKSCKNLFGVGLEVDKVIARKIDVGRSAQATIFLTKKKQLLCYIDSPTKLLLGDVKKLAVRIGIKVEIYFPPKGHPHYFEDIGREKFRDVFPGRTHINDADVMFYRTLAPYRPALLLISEVKDGTIYQADSDARNGWRPATRFTYRRIKTSS